MRANRLGAATPFRAERKLVRLSSWPAFGKNAGYYVAQQRGYFAKRGIELKLVVSYEHALSALAVRNVEIAQVLTTAALIAIENGAKYRIVAVRDAIFPVGTISLVDSDIHTPADYEGRKWGHTKAFSEDKVLLPLLGKYAGFDSNSVEIVDLTFPERLPALLRREVDFISAWWGSGYPEQVLAARATGKELNFFRWSDYGVDVYGDCLVARSDWLDAEPATARAFLAAARQGFEAAMADPAAAVTATMACNPDQAGRKEVVELAVSQSLQLLKDEFTREHGLFLIDRNKLRRTREAISNTNFTTPLDSAFTNGYLRKS